MINSQKAEKNGKESSMAENGNDNYLKIGEEFSSASNYLNNTFIQLLSSFLNINY